MPTLDSFYVRLSGLNLFYTETEDDLIVLGTIALKNIQATADGMEASCFRVIDQVLNKFTLGKRQLGYVRSRR